jgi:hypothetical protein
VAATLNFNLRESWRDLKRGRPGHRFQDRYKRARNEKPRCGTAWRVAKIAGAVISLAIALLLVVFPGPAIPFFFITGGLLATESRTIARFMDWGEVHLRNLGAWGKRHWKRLPTAGRIALLVVGACLSAGSMFLTYRMMTG